MSIDSIPLELLLEIFDFLWLVPPPSIKKLYDQPSFGITQSSIHNLKSVSIVSKKWRQITWPRLIRHARAFLPSESLQDSWPVKLQEFLALVQRSDLQSHIESFTLEVLDGKPDR